MLKTGINVPFLGIESNESNHDIGYNQFTGRQFWTDMWIGYDFTKPDPLYTSHCPGAREWFQVAFRLDGIYGMTVDII